MSDSFVHLLEQAETALEKTAVLIKAHYDACLREGFSPELALTFTLVWYKAFCEGTYKCK